MSSVSRTFPGLVVSLIVIAAVFANVVVFADELPQPKPNIVLIMADDVGLECFESYGPSQYKTPNITSLAKRGMQFNHCHSSPLCTPTRIKIMTGMSNVRNYHDFSILTPDQKTFAHYMKDAGYQTAVAGKWQLFGADNYGEMAGKGMTPEAAGFDEHSLWQIGKLGPRYWQPKLEKNGQVMTVNKDDYGPSLCTDFICDFIDRKKDKPFFVYYPMILAHNPFHPTPLSADRNSTDKKQNFVDMVNYMDHLVGRIVNQLEQAGVADNTLVLFLTDNGTNRSITSKVGNENIRGAKGLTIDHGTHSPLVAYWPGTVTAGTTCNDMIDLTDFLATFAELAKFELPADASTESQKKIDGISFAPQLLRGSNPNARKAIYCYYHPRPTRANFTGPVIFARNQDWKLYSDGRLFNVKRDPMEKNPINTNVVKEPARSNRALLQQMIDSMPSTGQNINKPKQ